MPDMKTPGVYIAERDALTGSIVEVATAVPAFVGYTEKAESKGAALLNKPLRITSMSDYISHFGAAPEPIFSLAEASSDAQAAADFSHHGTGYVLTQSSGRYLLYHCMKLFFLNGGGSCYVVSVGDYQNGIDAERFMTGIEALTKEREPTLLVIPETVLLDQPNSISVQQAALAHCGGEMKNRMAILDIWDGYRDRQDPAGDCIEYFRSALGTNYLDYAAAYYPWLNTTIVQHSELTLQNLDDKSQTLLGVEEREGAEALAAQSPLYDDIISAMTRHLNLLPPAAAMAGIYTLTDNDRGVWKAPANISLSAVVSPTVTITHDDQEDLNVTPQGKSINAIRTFRGEGVLVWGARTLDGNSLDWRYINVRRMMIMLEESIRPALLSFVFEPNDANTWVTIKATVENFLTGIWKRGGLAGSTPNDAFSVSIGLGETMTANDLLEGILRVTVFVAVTRPAEFIEMTFQQQMTES